MISLISSTLQYPLLKLPSHMTTNKSKPADISTSRVLRTKQSSLLPQFGGSQTRPEEFHKLLRFADREWEGIMRLGRYCGMGLSDIARLRFQHLSQDRRTLRLARRGKVALQEFPLGPKLSEYLLSLPSPASLEAPLFERAFGMNVDELKAEFSTLCARIIGLKTHHPMPFDALHFDIRRTHRPS